MKFNLFKLYSGVLIPCGMLIVILTMQTPSPIGILGFVMILFGAICRSIEDN